MACPDFQSLTLPLLTASAHGQDTSLSELRADIVRQLALSDDDRAETIPSGQSKLNNRSNWAAVYLTEAGLMEWVRRGTYRITTRGRQVLEQKPPRIDVQFLSQYDEFKAWKNRARDTTGPPSATAVAAPVELDESSVTPEEEIDAGYTALRRTVESELITRILNGSPKFFEDLVVELLVTMGYGGSRTDAGAALGKSGDGGIDGIIKEDRLGLDAIYIQAKRWDPKHRVSRPDVQAFAGSLEGARARKGVFITTSRFSGEAHDYVSRIEKKIVLIDGPHLSALMFDHGVGVRTKKVYEVKEVDEEYFLDD